LCPSQSSKVNNIKEFSWNLTSGAEPAQWSFGGETKKKGEKKSLLFSDVN
jgi:hypothetical protein